MKYGYLNISFQNNCFVWLMPRTGSNHMVKVLKNFSFDFYKILDGELNLIHKTTICNHSCGFFNGSDDFKFMASVRNPYSREVSRYFLETITNPNTGDFRNYIKTNQLFTNNPNIQCFDFSNRYPDYIVKLESLLEDYSKIPFIVESDFYRSGELEKLVKVKINDYKLNNRPWNSFYDEEIAEIVYEKYKTYFELFGYNENSWKL